VRQRAAHFGGIRSSVLTLGGTRLKMARMRRLLLLLACLPGAGLLVQGVPACTGDSGGCNEAGLASSPAFLLPFRDQVEEGKCTVTATVYEPSRGQSWMECVPYGDDCLCQGGGLPGVYEVTVYDLESSEELDDAEVTVYAAPPPECRDAEVTRAFDDAFLHGYLGAGGLGGGGGAGGAEP
jgi:hypothetical protein